VVQPLSNQATHFGGCIENYNVNKSSYNCNKTKTTFDARPIICVSFANEEKTQVKCIVILRWRAQK